MEFSNRIEIKLKYLKINKIYLLETQWYGQIIFKLVNIRPTDMGEKQIKMHVFATNNNTINNWQKTNGVVYLYVNKGYKFYQIPEDEIAITILEMN